MKTLKIFASLLLVVCMLFSLCSCFDKEKNVSYSDGDDEEFTASKKKKGESVVVEGDLAIHFLELGNKYTGDCTYIKAGDTDILIDAGSKVSSVKTIDSYISQYVTDKVIEYVIVTHAHLDHYAGFATNEKTDSLFDLYECKNIIDFSQITSGKEEQSSYKNYIRERDDEIKKGATHYTADECVEMGGDFDLGDGIVLDNVLYDALDLLFTCYVEHNCKNVGVTGHTSSARGVAVDISALFLVPEEAVDPLLHFCRFF